MVMGEFTEKTEVVVIGAGPGGYVAALRAADLGKEVILIERRPQDGGVCLLEGCIPSKTLIAAVETIHTAMAAKEMGVTFKDLAVDIDAMRAFKEKVVGDLSRGVSGLLKGRGVTTVRGSAHFTDSKTLRVEGDENAASDLAGVKFEHAIIATGSRPALPPFARGVEGVWDSTAALELREIPKRLLVVGGGYIGLELGLVYAGLGSKVAVVELLPGLLAGMDPDLVRVVKKSCEARFESLRLSTKVTAIKKQKSGFAVTIETGGKSVTETFDRVLVAVGRRPNTDDLGLDKTGVKVREDGFIEVDETRRTAETNIFAIGDVTPGPMLAHKASREGKVAAEVIAGHPSAFDNRAIPAVVFTDPELVSAGLTEAEAKNAGLNVNVARFPLAALGRAKTIGRTEGVVKIVADKDSGLLLGIGIAAPHASEMIAECALAIEMGATLEDLASTIHPHPTLSESIMEAAETALGACVHVARPKKK
ncbi:dihydrolipoyl dehydrogenase [bacterium]|nr:dihydrolipoyl dehydrogenase [bacterium]